MEDSEIRRYKFRSTCAQILATLCFNCLMVDVGFIIAMPIQVIGALRLDVESPLHLTEEQASWFGGLMFLAQPVGSLVSGFLQERLGRKKCMMLVNIPEFAAWLMIHYANSVSTLFASATLLGLSMGFMEAPVLSYVGEISEPRLRGFLNTFGGIFYNIGFVINAFIGANTDWRTMVLICSGAPVVAFIAMSLVPDSPAWLVTKGRIEDARRSYQWLRGWVPPHEVQGELEALVAYVRQKQNSTNFTECEQKRSTNEEQTGLIPEAQKSSLKIFLQPSIQRPMRLILFFFFISACCSLSAMKPFFIEILSGLHLPVRPHIVIVYGSSLNLLGALTATLTMRRVGKRCLTFASLILSIICCLGLSLYFALGLQPWIAIILFSLSYYAATLGIILVPWLLISELFPLKGRGMAGGVTAALAYLIMFLVIKTYYDVASLLDMWGACLLYGGVGLVGLVYLYRNLPETEGIPLVVIEEIMKASTTRV